MYRNCKCLKNCNNCNDSTNMLETSCENVPNIIENYDSCDCGFGESENYFPTNPMFGQSYVPFQTMTKTFTPEIGLKMGTIFPELVSPYVPNQSMREIEYIALTNEIKEGCNR